MTVTVLSPSGRTAADVGAEEEVLLNGFQATVSAASLGALLANKSMRLRGLRAKILTCGSADSTTVQVHKNGVAVTGAEVTIAHDAADGTVAQAGVDVAVSADDIIELVVSAAPTGGAHLCAQARLVVDFAP